MPLLAPLNDHQCLSKLHQNVKAFMATPKARRIASQFDNLQEVVEFIRMLDQRDDLGDPSDGPRLSCEVTQRLRLPALDPNCFERLALFLSIALQLDPAREMTSATMMLDNGLHSFPVEIRNGIPRAVVLDPHTAPPCNAMDAVAYQMRNTSPLPKKHIGPWFVDLARNACIDEGAEECYESAMSALRNSLLTGNPITNKNAIECVFKLAHRDADLFGTQGRTAYERVRKSLRNFSFALDSKRVAQFMNNLMDTAEPLAAQAIKTALIAKYGPAAQIALQGVDLAMAQQASNDNVGSLNLSLESSPETAHDDDDDDDEKAEKADKKDDNQPLTREQKRKRMRRMTLSFRPNDSNKEK